MHKLARLKKRKEFLSVSRTNIKWVTPAFILQLRPWDKNEEYGGIDLRFGITASKKTGNAVRRNRIRRRLRALAQEILPIYSMPRYDFVLIARYSAWDREYTDLKSDLQKALKNLKICADANC
ncbi:MAG: ribonuclease P protein component [Alphaproteobacteria bacterium]